MKKLEDSAAFFFIIAVTFLSFISILGVWDLFSRDVINKSFETLGLLAIVAVVVMVAGKFYEGRSSQADNMVPTPPNPVFKDIRQTAIGLLIISASGLAIFGVMAIWDVAEKDILYKSLSSVAILAFAVFIIVMTALEREGSSMLQREGKKISGGGILLLIILAYIVMSFGRFF